MGGIMKKIICQYCGSGDIVTEGNKRICRYCRSVYVVEQSDAGIKNSEISLKNDIDQLLEKCRRDPKNAYRYANLILDIDPGNEEAEKFL